MTRTDALMKAAQAWTHHTTSDHIMDVPVAEVFAGILEREVGAVEAERDENASRLAATTEDLRVARVECSARANEQEKMRLALLALIDGLRWEQELESWVLTNSTLLRSAGALVGRKP